MNESKITADDVKLIIATVSIVVATLASFYSVKVDVAVLSTKFDSTMSSIQSNQNDISKIISINSTQDSRLSVLEEITHLRP